MRLSGLTAGKDRHSKVRTAKGLRDRTVSLSDPTAIQLYIDLQQERLCVEQPSIRVNYDNHYMQRVIYYSGYLRRDKTHIRGREVAYGAEISSVTGG